MVSKAEIKGAIPSLSEAALDALHFVATKAFESYDVKAIVACGTIVRGTPDPNSDLDIQIVHRGTFRERLQEWHFGIPCEIFVNPPAWIERYMEEEHAERRPLTAHMYATGVILYDPEGIAKNLKERAKKQLLDPPAPDEQSLIAARYSASTMLEDAMDLRERDPDAAALVLGQAVWQLASARILAEPGWIPRHKELLGRLREVDPGAARLVAMASTGSSLDDRFEAARQLSIGIAGAPGFFEWASSRQEMDS